jgi:hypothetical protein
MAREIEIEGFEILLIPKNEWRARLRINSRVREKDDEYFNARIGLLIENYNTTPPEEIKKEIFIKLRDAFIEITEWLKKQTI